MEDVDWLDIPPLPILDAEYAQLSISEIIEREEILARSLGCFAGRWVAIRNSAVVLSAATPREMIGRRPAGIIQFVPPAETGFLL